MTTTAPQQHTTTSSHPATVTDLVGALRASFAAGRTKPISWRLEQLHALQRFLTEQETEIAKALASDLGRNPHDSWFGDIATTAGEVKYAIRHLKKWVRPRRVNVPLALRPGRAAYSYEPLGVVLIIGPWNYPFYLCLAPLVGAIAAGNCAIVKPSEHAPASSAAMAGLLPCYLDADAIAIVEGDQVITQQLIDARMDHIFFTGGTEVGRKVMQAAAKQLTPVTLELGGKCPAIVTEDADLEVAGRRIAWGKLLNSGQTCLAPDYVLAHETVKDELVAKLTASFAEMRQDQPLAQPIINTAQHQQLKELLQENAGKVVFGGDSQGTSIEPTIVVDPNPDAKLMQEEIFGPILPVLGVTSLDQAISFVNAREKPLAAYVFSRRKADQKRVFDEIPCGGATANHTLMHVLAPQLPFGGVGESGSGAYHGKWGFECFSHRKATLTMPSRPDIKLIYPPQSDRAKRILRRLA
jgi:aldehyde dehydrogenase (NAD+)